MNYDEGIIMRNRKSVEKKYSKLLLVMDSTINFKLNLDENSFEKEKY